MHDSVESAQPEPPKKKKQSKNKYGEFQNVLLTETEHQKLAEDFGAALREKAISFLDAYIEEKGYKSKSHNLAIRRWVMDAVNEKETKPQKYGRKEKVPGWVGFEPGNAELDGLQKILNTAGNNPEIAERAEKLKQSLLG